MNTTKLLIAIVLMTMSLAFSSCKKEKETAGLDTDAIAAESVSSFVEKGMNADEDAPTMKGANGSGTLCNWQLLLPECAVVTESGDTFPKTITIDYGTGCTNANGITKSGIVHISISDEMTNPGAVRTVTFENYVINNTAIEGSRVTTNIGTNGTSQPIFSRNVNTVLTRDDMTITRTANEEITWISGYDTEECGDNIFSVTGTGTCTRGNGVTRTRTIISPLIIDHSCSYITQGIVQFNGPNGTGTMNFGDGTCDDLAVVIRPNGVTQEIHLHQH